jgi:Pyruvate/2-oxoacid:ferredoxin oxidoreductase delta subunit
LGHLVGKDIYRKLGTKIDNLSTRAPWNKVLYEILRELYTEDEATLIVEMPYGISTLDHIEKTTKINQNTLLQTLDGLCAKGLVMDLWINGKYYYMISPLVIGIFEFTMMRTGGNIKTKEWAKLFHEYLLGDDSFQKANCGDGQKISPLRVLPHEETITDTEFVEILDYDKATAIVDGAKQFAIGLCSCRHEKLHLGLKKCQTPLDTCTTLGFATSYMIKHGFAKPVERSQMLENLARSKELGLVICADNVNKDISFFCFCCGCCCNVMLGISKLGYPNTVVTSNYIARRNPEDCLSCGDCAEACPIKSITLQQDGSPEINESTCIGCGVCALKCQTGAIRLTKRQQRVFRPEDTFERIILQSLERGTLQNIIFSDPGRLTHQFMRGFLGAFLRIPPVKKALIGDSLRSSFLGMLRKGA